MQRSRSALPVLLASAVLLGLGAADAGPKCGGAWRVFSSGNKSYNRQRGTSKVEVENTGGSPVEVQPVDKNGNPLGSSQTADPGGPAVTVDLPAGTRKVNIRDKEPGDGKGAKGTMKFKKSA